MRLAEMILVSDEEHVAPLLDSVQDVEPVVGFALDHLECRMDLRVAGEHLLDAEDPTNLLVISTWQNEGRWRGWERLLEKPSTLERQRIALC